jgi:hypothetical protein
MLTLPLDRALFPAAARSQGWPRGRPFTFAQLTRLKGALAGLEVANKRQHEDLSLLLMADPERLHGLGVFAGREALGYPFVAQDKSPTLFKGQGSCSVLLPG